MKTLTYAGRTIDFEDPSTITFSDTFHEALYTLAYRAITNGAPYAPAIDVDHIFDKRLGIDLPAEAAAASVELQKPPSKNATNRDRLEVQSYVRQFLVSFQAMLGLFQNSVVDAATVIKCAEILEGEACDETNFIKLKQVIDNVNSSAWNRQRDSSETQSGNTTLGTISEELINLAVATMVDGVNLFKVSSPKVNSYGDFVAMCLPNNLWISVKSNYARERLLASGYSNDILGVGFFEKHDEFISQVRIRNFQRAGFLAMYCPDVAVSAEQVKNSTNTYDQVCAHHASKGTSMPLNINGKPFIRKLSNLGLDLKALLSKKNVQRRFTVDF